MIYAAYTLLAVILAGWLYIAVGALLGPGWHWPWNSRRR